MSSVGGSWRFRTLIWLSHQLGVQKEGKNSGLKEDAKRRNCG